MNRRAITPARWPRRVERWLRRAALPLLLLGCPSPVPASVAGSFSLVSNEMFRGRSVSAGQPVARVGVAYDDRSGAYAGVSLSGVATRHDGAQFFDAQEYAGYAHRLSRSLTLDVGVINVDYGHYWSGERASGYTELYLGLIGRRISTHASISPNYFSGGVVTAYIDVDAVLLSRGDWSLNGHAGLFFWVAGGRPAAAPATHYDWRVMLNRTIARAQLRIGWAQGGPNRDFYRGRARPHGAPIVSLSAAF